MRTINEIAEAVNSNAEATEEELRLALLSLDSIGRFAEQRMRDLVEEVERGLNGANNEAALRIRLTIAKKHPEFYFKAVKLDPKTYLGPDGIPGSPGKQAMQKIALGLYRKVMEDFKKKGEQLMLLRGELVAALKTKKNKNNFLYGKIPGVVELEDNPLKLHIDREGQVTVFGKVKGWAVTEYIVDRELNAVNSLPTEDDLQSVQLHALLTAAIKHVEEGPSGPNE